MDFVFIDSGTGGIPYLSLLKQKCPSASCAYVADNANFPYGEKSHDQIVECVLKLVDKIIKKLDPKVIVIACNTMSVNALAILREAYENIQFVGTVPAIKLAASVSKTRKIGLLATNSTINSPYNQDLKNHFAADCDLVLRGDPDLIAFVEHKSFTATEEERLEACKPAVEFFRNRGCDAIILGCTHFLNLAEEFAKAAGKDMKIVDSREGVVNRALSVIPDGIAAEAADQGEISPLFMTSDKKDEKEYSVICQKFGLLFKGKL